MLDNKVICIHFISVTKQYQTDSPRGSYPDHGGGRGYQSDRNSRNYNSQESTDWQKAAEAWARSKNRDTNNTPRSDGRNTPRTVNQRTPRFDDLRSDIDRTRMKNVGKSPARSMRSTPRTNTSPHSMSLGDATPLYDENI